MEYEIRYKQTKKLPIVEAKRLIFWRRRKKGICRWKLKEGSNPVLLWQSGRFAHKYIFNGYSSWEQNAFENKCGLLTKNFIRKTSPVENCQNQLYPAVFKTAQFSPSQIWNSWPITNVDLSTKFRIQETLNLSTNADSTTIALN